jgi:hypothetical protein
LQTGVAAKAAHCVSSVQPPQVWFGLQVGASKGQSVLATHSTQIPPPLTAKQTGVSPVQAEEASGVHWTQLPVVSLQTGVAE